MTRFLYDDIDITSMSANHDNTHPFLDLQIHEIHIHIQKQTSISLSDGEEDDLPPPFQRLGGSGGEELRSAFTRFARDSARQSLASNNSAVFRWMEAQQKAEEEAMEVGIGC